MQKKKKNNQLTNNKINDKRYFISYHKKKLKELLKKFRLLPRRKRRFIYSKIKIPLPKHQTIFPNPKVSFQVIKLQWKKKKIWNQFVKKWPRIQKKKRNNWKKIARFILKPIKKKLKSCNQKIFNLNQQLTKIALLNKFHYITRKKNWQINYKLNTKNNNENTQDYTITFSAMTQYLNFAQQVKFLQSLKNLKKIIPYQLNDLPRYQKRKAFSHASIFLFTVKRWTILSEKRMKLFLNTWKSDRLTNPGYYDSCLLTPSPFLDTSFLNEYWLTSNLTKKLKIKTKNLKKLKIKLFSKLPYLYWKRPNKYHKSYCLRTRKQNWLTTKNTKKRYLLKKKNINFLKTFLGQQFLTAYNLSHDEVRFKYWIKRVVYYDALRFLHVILLTQKNFYKQFTSDQKRAWFYTNFVKPKRLPYYFQKFFTTKVYPYSKFEEHFTKSQLHPWLGSLICNRLLYKGSLARNKKRYKISQLFSWTPYLRKKKPIHSKKNKLYNHRKHLLFKKNNTELVRVRQRNRIKQILCKINLPFYGHLKIKQFHKLTKKVQCKKNNRLHLQLNLFERRLDVIVFRLNLAPNIFWARKLIQDGSIFVNSITKKQVKIYDTMYAHYKKYAYPLKLRDPKHLYKNIQLKPQAKLQFLLEPLRNINYLTQPGDLILCAPSALLNQFKTKSSFWKKPLAKHLLNISHRTKSKKKILMKKNHLTNVTTKEQMYTNVGLILFSPTFKDLPKNDRITQSFFRWMTL